MTSGPGRRRANRSRRSYQRQRPAMGRKRASAAPQHRDRFASNCGRILARAV